MGLYAEAHASLERKYERRLCDFDRLDAHASDGEVLIGGGDIVRHDGGIDGTSPRLAMVEEGVVSCYRWVECWSRTGTSSSRSGSVNR